MNYKIREIKENEYEVLDDFLYEAIFIPDGMQPPPKSIILNNELQVYVQNFGQLPDDKCFVAELNGVIIGAVWCRMMKDYGYVNGATC